MMEDKLLLLHKIQKVPAPKGLEQAVKNRISSLHQPKTVSIRWARLAIASVILLISVELYYTSTSLPTQTDSTLHESYAGMLNQNTLYDE